MEKIKFKLFLILFLYSCDPISESTLPPKVTVTMLRVPRIELYDYQFITPLTIWGELQSEEVNVSNMTVTWLSDMYWNENDSSGFYRLLCRTCNNGIWFDLDGTKDTIQIDLMRVKWITEVESKVDDLGRFYNTLTPIRPMVDRNMWLWWFVEGTLVDSQQIFLME